MANKKVPNKAGRAENNRVTDSYTLILLNAAEANSVSVSARVEDGDGFDGADLGVVPALFMKNSIIIPTTTQPTVAEKAVMDHV